MKKLFAIAFVFILAFVYAGFHFASSRTRVFRVGTECDLTNSWEEEQPTDTNVPLANKEGFYAEGYDVQIAKIVAKAIGAKLEVKRIEWGKLLPALNENEIDAIFSSMLDTEERKKVADSSSSSNPSIMPSMSSSVIKVTSVFRKYLLS